ncbi:trans-aconitate 3-methyltransferase [Plakobranchus ocellatus]|uniref:Trans-aconitate 3-methyltransferase n=1 Tax=Plakobranchus ocellatus TaxID=259542 RepID=A0AAV4CWV5_9GAST|nr:trans-aconitate 3-methyltransferase [Plakobranchus ocellatus]
MCATEIAQAKAMMSTTVDKTKMYADLDQSKAYAEFRPRYSDELFKAIVDYCKETNPNLNMAVDVGCGPGMSTIGFTKYFKKVIGVDVSETQIACAPKNIPNAEFRTGYSDKLPFIKSGTVDLFCSGESFNLMPQKETFAEADRVLRPGGTIALFGYDVMKASKPEINAVIQKLWIKFLPYWPKESTMIFDKFRNVTLPYSDFKRREDLQITGNMNMTEYIGLMKSLWPFVAYSKDHPEEDVAGELERDMLETLNQVNAPGDKTFDFAWDLFVLMGHKPKN